MSRHRDPVLQNSLIVDVGWDDSLQTSFAQVRRILPAEASADEDNTMLLRFGAEWQNCRTVADLTERLATYAVRHAHILSQLRSDLADATRPTPLQMQARLGAP